MQNMKLQLSGESFWVWFIKIFTGLFIVFFLILHFIVNHLIAPGGLLTYADVLAYYSNPIIPAIEIIFLITVIPHALLGLRSILLDLNPPLPVIKALNYIFISVGTLGIIYGIWLIVILVNRIAR